MGKVAVVALLLKLSSGAVTDVVSGIMDGVSVNAARAEMKLMHGKLMEYYTAYQHYPLTLNALTAFFKQEFDSPAEVVMTDPWQTSYYFITPKVEILCFGPDKKRNTRDDLDVPYPNNVRHP